MALRSQAVEIIRTLRASGHQAYLVGGCVRDLLLGREPVDYDVATDATPDAVMRLFPRTWAVGAQFGVVLVPVESELEPAGDATDGAKSRHHAVEVATFRSDGRYSDGRHPDQVRYALNPEEDVKRRDFTINGLLIDPLVNDRVLDFVGGEIDLRAGVIRTIGDPERRFGEDKLRLLRAVRFAARFGFTIEPQTFAAIRELAPQVRSVSQERIRDELTKMLTEGQARRAFELLDETGLLHEVLPDVEKMKGVEQPPQFHPEGDVWVHTRLILEKLAAGCPRTLAWGALLHDVGKPPTFRVAPDRIRFDRHVEVGEAIARDICEKLRMSNDDTEQILALIANHMRFADVPRMKESTLKRFLRLPKFDQHLELHRMDCLSSHRNLAIYEALHEKLAHTPPEQIRPAPLITGHDLIALGMKPGPQFSAILSAVEDAQLEGRLYSKAEALAYVQRRI
ncbi:MAG: CCA tRNA nucleotidyltransferase [Terriglobales bacterium]|jgi:poly(A) polymerase